MNQQLVTEDPEASISCSLITSSHRPKQYHFSVSIVPESAHPHVPCLGRTPQPGVAFLGGSSSPLFPSSQDVSTHRFTTVANVHDPPRRKIPSGWMPRPVNAHLLPSQSARQNVACLQLLNISMCAKAFSVVIFHFRRCYVVAPPSPLAE